MIGNPNETYYRYLARSRAACIARVGVHGRQERPTNGQVRPLCRSGRGTGIRGTAKALEGFGALALALVLVLLPRVAFASVASDQYGEPVYGPVEYDWQGEHYTNVAYIAANKYDAAAYACGYSKSEVGQWDITVRAKLSNQSTARAFYELANGFFAPSPDDYVYTDYGPAPGFWGWAYTIYGEGNIWYHDGYTDTQVNSAKSEVESILNGGGSGSGSTGGGVLDGNYYFFDWTDEDRGVTDWSGSVRLLPARLVVDGFCITKASYESALSAFEGQDFYMVGRYGPEYASNKFGFGIICSPEEPTSFDYAESRAKPFIYWAAASPSRSFVTYSFYTDFYSNSSISTVEYSGKKYLSCSLTRGSSSNSSPRSLGPYQYLYYSDDDTVEPPENNWPETDEPSTPTPPDPYAPTGGGDYVAPTLPKPTSPTQPVGVSVTVATPVDDILDALNKIIQELENHCVHLQNKMVECSRYLGALEEQTRDAVIDAINEGMQNDVTLHDELMDYLRELFQWMKDNMKYDVEVTNTNNNDDVIDWLKRIYIQDGTGYSNSRPIDITQDYNGFGVWVDDLLGYVLPDLTDTNLAPVTSAFDALDDKFPFSVPGDVLRIFQSLDRSPVTPVVGVTIPSVLGIPAYTYSFDLSPYDTTMQTIRTIEFMAFVVFLLVWGRRAFMTEAGGVDD